MSSDRCTESSDRDLEVYALRVTILECTLELDPTLSGENPLKLIPLEFKGAFGTQLLSINVHSSLPE